MIEKIVVMENQRKEGRKVFEKERGPATALHRAAFVIDRCAV